MSLAIGLNLFNAVNTLVFTKAVIVSSDSSDGTEECKKAQKVMSGVVIASTIATSIKILSILGTGSIPGVAVSLAFTAVPIMNFSGLVKNRDLLGKGALVLMVVSSIINLGGGVHSLISQPFLSAASCSGLVNVIALLPLIYKALAEEFGG